MIQFNVTPDGGETYQLKATSRDIYIWEKTHRGKVFGAIAEAPPMVDLYEIAHQAARSQGLFSGTLDEFVNSHLIEGTQGEGEPDPTRPAP